MKNGIHPGAIACFAIATVCYLLAWIPFAWIFAALAIFFEVAAWILLWSGTDDDE